MQERLVILIIGLLTIVSILVARATNQVTLDNIENITLKKKPIFDGTMYDNKNYKNLKFFPSINILYNDKLKLNRNSPIDLKYLKTLAKALPKSSAPYILDVEFWNVHTINDIEARKNIDKYILIIDTIKRERPDLKFGYYGVLPNRNYWIPIKQNPIELRRWLHINSRLKRLAKHVDVICPSLYTFYDNPKEWKIYATENIKIAKEYGKPVYPFIWPRYHEGGNIRPKWKSIDKEFWETQLSLVYKEADGIIIWGAWNLTSSILKSRNWNEKAKWWKVTKQFIKQQNMREIKPSYDPNSDKKNLIVP